MDKNRGISLASLGVSIIAFEKPPALVTGWVSWVAAAAGAILLIWAAVPSSSAWILRNWYWGKVSLAEAATRAATATRHTLLFNFDEGHGTAPMHIHTRYLDSFPAMKIPIFGKVAPSTRDELVQIPSGGAFVDEGNAWTHTAGYPSKYVDLQMRKSDLRRAIKGLQSGDAYLNRVRPN